ncbi:MAG: SiaB family protein kinase [Bacteroidia bacterium]
MSRNLQLVTLLRKCFSGDKICIFYRGNFDDIFTDKLISLAEHDAEKKAKKRISFLISESFQNIVRHGNAELGHAHDSLFGMRSVAPFSHIFSSNTITEKDKAYLEEKLGFINQLDPEQLKLHYTKILSEGSLSDKGGAGLGLIEMAKRSKKPIQTEFKEHKDHTFAFNMQIDLIVDDNAPADLLENPMTIEENTAMYDLMTDNNMIFLYKGDFSDETISPMLNILEGNTVNSGDSIGYKIYHAAVELMQNVVRHGANPSTKEGIFAINRTENGYFLCTGNYVTGNSFTIGEYITKLNLLNKDELNTLYRQQLKASVNLPENSAGVGLIDLRRSFMTPIEIKLTEDKNGHYLTIGIEIPFSDGKQNN